MCYSYGSITKCILQDLNWLILFTTRSKRSELTNRDEVESLVTVFTESTFGRQWFYFVLHFFFTYFFKFTFLFNYTQSPEDN